MNWFDYLAALGAFAGGMATVYTVWVRPRQKAHEQHEKERAEIRRKSDAFMFGIAPIEGVTDGALSAPRRMQAMETSMKEVVSGQGVLAKRMDEANGTTRRIETMVSGLVTSTLTTKKALDIAAESVAEAAHQTALDVASVAQQTALSLAGVAHDQHQETLEAVQHHHEEPTAIELT